MTYIAAVAEVMRAKLYNETALPCPECATPGPHDCNSDRIEPTACCTRCGAHFDLHDHPSIREAFGEDRHAY